MKKILLFLIFSLFFAKISAQLDREHWFAPMYDGQSNASGYEQFLHLSTNETVPFTVFIYSNNTLFDQVVISKGSPGVIEIPREYIITDGDSDDLNKVITKGIYVKGDKPLFANLRFGVTNHAEIITSKGTAGIGTDFYTVMAPNAQISLYYGATASFLATEDNTTITVGDFKKVVTFNGLGTPSSVTFTLNKGQSYILDARTIDSTINKDAFIGAKITSDKPISMTNGNFNGQYASSTAEGSDILMDQSVPVDKLGDEFVIVKGYGLIGNNMEGAIIVATEKNTAIYLNDDTVPVVTLANEGDYYKVGEINYQDRGNGHYNLHISTDKNVYVYQLLGGVEGAQAGATPFATGGMNYIPPLNCYLPRKIDEISYINKIKQTDSDSRFITKLNIITEKGAVVKVNGLPPSSVHGPYDVSNIAANQKWVSYSIPNVKGNITVESDKAVTAGIASGNGAFGYGGYFAGFSSIPLILKTEGDCLPGVKLSVTEGFDSYKWYNKDDPTTILSTANSFSPSQAGIYYVKIQQGSCPEIQTGDFKFYNCTTYTNVDYETCKTLDDITPKFTLSTQAVNPGSISITEQGTLGTATVLANGKIQYVPQPGKSGQDKFKFSFCGTGAIPDCETIQATINIDLTIGQNAALTSCNINGIAEYDLTKAQVTAAKSTVEGFYYTQNGADNQIAGDLIPNFTAFQSVEGFAYARVKGALGCAETEAIQLKFFPTAELLTSVYEDCENVLKGKVDVKLSNIRQLLLKDPAYFTDVKFYSNGVLLTSDDWSYSTDTILQMEVKSPDGCLTKVFPVTFRFSKKTPLITSQKSVDVCDENFDGIKEIKNLDDYKALFTNDPSVTAQFYLTKNDLQTQSEINVDKTRTLFVVLRNSTDCPSLAELTINIKLPVKSDILKDKTICPEDVTDLDAEAGPGCKYEWFKEGEAAAIGTGHYIDGVGIGKYYVIITAPNDCLYTQNVEIKAADLPVITGIEINGSTVKIIAAGGKEPLQYAVDNSPYQSSDTFTNVTAGIHKAYVISADNCEPVEKEFSVVEIYNMISPNDDGVNDVLDMSLLSLKNNVKFQIFDRAGQKLFDGTTANNYIWTGKLNGKTLPTSSYWYIIEWQDSENSPPVKYAGWVLLKNRNSE